MELDMMNEKPEVENNENPVKQKKRFSWKNVLKGAAILFCGMIIGSVITAHVGHHLMFKFLGDPQHMADKTTRRIERKLDLSSEQTKQVREILSRRSEIISADFKESHKRLEEQFDLVYEEVSQVLDEKQKKKWKAHHDKLKKRHDRHFKNE